MVESTKGRAPAPTDQNILGNLVGKGRKLVHHILSARHQQHVLYSRPSLVRVVTVPWILHTALRTILSALDLKRKMARSVIRFNSPGIIVIKA